VAKKPTEKADEGGASVFCRMTIEEKALLERAIAKRAIEVPDGTFSLGKTMVRVAVAWAKTVLGETETAGTGRKL
jgi:hypothetical protein